MVTMSRFINAVALLALGFLGGTVMTFGHQASISMGGIEIPWGLVVSIIGVSTLLIGVRLLSPTRRPVIWVATGVIAAVIVLALPGPGGSVIIPNGIVGMVWALAPSFIAILVVLWPAPRTGQGTSAN